MAINRGKQFEDIIKKAFEGVPNTIVARLHDQTTGFYGSKNPCDFFIYHEPILYTIECKSIHGNTLPFSNISDFQWQKLLEMGKVPGVVSGVLCWWVDRDITLFIPIQRMQEYKEAGFKSVRFDIFDAVGVFQIAGKKKRVFFDYDMDQFFREVGEWAK